MANDAKKISDLNTVTAAANTDRLLILTNPATTANVNTIALSDLRNSLPPQKTVQNTFGAVTSLILTPNTNNNYTANTTYSLSYANVSFNITVSANHAISYSNIVGSDYDSDSQQFDGVQFGSFSADKLTVRYVVNPIVIDLTVPVQKLHIYPSGYSGTLNYLLNPGSEGQSIKFVPYGLGNTQVTVTISNARYFSNGNVQVANSYVWTPFNANSAMAEVLFTDGYWNLPHP